MVVLCQVEVGKKMEHSEKFVVVKCTMRYYTEFGSTKKNEN